MVLVAPALHPRPLADAADGGGGADAAGAAGGADGPTSEEGSGREVLALLRGDTTARPRFDPGLAGGLRAWLEDAAFGAAGAGPGGERPRVFGSRHLMRSEAGGAGEAEAGTAPVSRLAARLVRVLFRQIVHAGTVDDPLRDALDAVAAAGEQGVVRDVDALAEADRVLLAATVARHSRNLGALVPRFAPGWLPRTDDYVAIPLAGGRIVLCGAFDLLVGLPRRGTASLCAVGVATTGVWARERRSLHFLALLETLRSGTPPFRMALLDSSTGHYGVEDVREEHLRAMAAHVAAWLTSGAAAA
jgi:hypothetical protein